LQELAKILSVAASHLNLWSALDILIVAAIIFGLLSLVRGTSAFSILYGLGFLLLIVVIVGSMPNLVMFNWLLRNSLPVLSLALIVVFQPELRRAMERLGRVRSLIERPLGAGEPTAVPRSIEEVARACRRLSERRQGALVVFERETGLQEYVETGVEVHGLVSTEMLLTIFFPNSPLHDGATIVHGDQIVAAGCVLPLSEGSLDFQLGTRHRAALGITEVSDAVAVVVSEETGTISLANNGRIVRNLDEAKLRKVLSVLCRPPTRESFSLWPHRRHRESAKSQAPLASARDDLVRGPQ
jgi:diadenylate cyclase